MSPNSDPAEPSSTEIEPAGAEAVDEVTEAPQSNRRFAVGMLIYLVLAILATVTLDGPIRIATWLFLGGLAVKTWIAVLKKSQD